MNPGNIAVEAAERVTSSTSGNTIYYLQFIIQNSLGRYHFG